MQYYARHEETDERARDCRTPGVLSRHNLAICEVWADPLRTMGFQENCFRIGKSSEGPGKRRKGKVQMKRDNVKLWLARDRTGKYRNYFIFAITDNPHYDKMSGWMLSGRPFGVLCYEEVEALLPKGFHLKGGPKSLIQIEIRRVTK